jgi:hypothetical protein
MNGILGVSPDNVRGIVTYSLCGLQVLPLW